MESLALLGHEAVRRLRDGAAPLARVQEDGLQVGRVEIEVGHGYRIKY